MRCEACNTILTPFEDSLKGVHSDKRLGLCAGCLSDTGIEFYGDPAAEHCCDDTTPEELTGYLDFDT